jgi:hypothetical protein
MSVGSVVSSEKYSAIPALLLPVVTVAIEALVGCLKRRFGPEPQAGLVGARRLLQRESFRSRRQIDAECRRAYRREYGFRPTAEEADQMRAAVIERTAGADADEFAVCWNSVVGE